MKKTSILLAFTCILITSNGLCSELISSAPTSVSMYSQSRNNNTLKPFTRNINLGLKPEKTSPKDNFFGIAIPRTKLTGEQNSRTGYSVSASGDYVVFGAPEDDVNGNFSGSAHAYKYENEVGWVSEKHFIPSDGDAGDEFGNSIAMSGDHMIVGAYHDEGNYGYESGSAYIYRRNGSGGWDFVSKPFASDGEIGDEFGTAVAMSGDHAIVGAPAKDGWNGAVYVFKKDASGNWNEETKIVTGNVNCAAFGNSISISEDYIAAGTTGGTEMVFIYKRNGTSWTLHSQITDLWNSYTYLRCSISGDYMVVGTPFGMNGGNTDGAAYVYKRNGTEWIRQVKFLPNSGDHQFGRVVSIFDDYVAVGSGEISIFARHGENWSEVTRQAGDLSGTFFGSAVSVSAKHFVAGDFLDWSNGPYSGAVYIYDIISKFKKKEEPSTY